MAHGAPAIGPIRDERRGASKGGDKGGGLVPNPNWERVVLIACRYFGSSREYWWNNLTWALFEEISQHLAEEPPADRLIRTYFEINKWWSPPTPAGSAKEPVESDGELWESGLPETTD